MRTIMQTSSALQPLALDDLDRVTGGLSITPDRRFAGEGPFLTEVLRRGMNRSKPSASSARRPGLRKSTTNPGWCDDGFGIVPCR
jgi:hypothetical protein